MPTVPKFERTLKRLLRILDLSRDLERNYGDAAFRNIGGEIIYVFDHNVFELFIRPWRHREYVETFYGDLWLPSEGVPDGEAWRQIEVQSGIVASEYLLGGDLPGAKTDRIYVSDHHRWELAQRVGDLAAAFKTDLESSLDAASGKLLRKLEGVKDLLGAATGAVRQSDQAVLGLEEDVEALARASAPPAVQDRFRVTRVAADALAADRVVEPLEQLERLISLAIRDRISSIQGLYPPKSSDVASHEAQAKLWYANLVAELAQPGHAKRVRDDRALWNDAHTLAYLRWAALRASAESKRLVFVTGDPVLFDTYRRWYATAKPTDAGYYEPFILRRITQYAPIFNLSDADTDARQDSTRLPENEKSLPGLLHEGLEATLLALSISTLGQSGGLARDAVVGRARERYALKLVDRTTLSDDEDLAPLHDVMSQSWLEDHDTLIRRIRSRWQAAQRAAIGSSFKLISQRLVDRERSLAEEIAREGADKAGPILKRYISELLDVVVNDSLELWLPLASEFIRSRSVKRAADERPRVPLTLDLILPGGLTLSTVLLRWWEGKAGAGELASMLSPLENPELTRRPALVFAVASALALASQEANEAERFAAVAVKAIALGSEKDQETEDYELEFTFLHALTLRFQMAAIGPQEIEPDGRRSRDAARVALRQTRHIYRRAVDALNRHLTLLEKAKARLSPERHHLLSIRHASERSALSLFMATAMLVAHRSGVRDDFFSETPGLIADSKRHILECLRLEPEDEDSGTDLLARMKRQYLPNIAAAETLSALVDWDHDYRFDEALRPYEKRLSRFMGGLTGAPPLLRAEYLAFQVLAGRTPINPLAQFAALRRAAQRSLKLPMDVALFDAIVREFG